MTEPELNGPTCPCCGADAAGLEMIARFFDVINGRVGITCDEIQNDLRTWAEKIRYANEVKP